MNQQQQNIEKLKAILKGRLTVKEAFKPFTWVTWTEVSPGLFKRPDSDEVLTSDQIHATKTERREYDVVLYKFYPDGRLIPPTASREQDVILDYN
jgi:hypothetical protein